VAHCCQERRLRAIRFFGGIPFALQRFGLESRAFRFQPGALGFEPHLQRCRAIAGRLRKTLVANGDRTLHAAVCGFGIAGPRVLFGDVAE
jgi:hypothetical protein